MEVMKGHVAIDFLHFDFSSQCSSENVQCIQCVGIAVISVYVALSSSLLLVCYLC